MMVGTVEFDHNTTQVFRVKYVSHTVERHSIAMRNVSIRTMRTRRNMDYDAIIYPRHEQLAGFRINGNTLRPQEPADRTRRGRVS
jgi:hypothetical protein